MNNSAFGKTTQNLRKRINFRLVNDVEDYKKCVRKPSFVSQKLFSKNFVAIHEIKPVLTLNKPIYVGFSIHDLNKLLMYEFHYKYIKSKFDVNLLFTDTDSLVYEIEAEDIYEDFYKDKNLFDFSDYPLHSKLFDPVNKKVIGKTKDELKGKIIIEFIGLNSKMYSVTDVAREEVKKAKGVNNKYIDVLFNIKIMKHKMKRIQSKLHKIGTYDVCKISFSCFSDKRYILDDDINSLAYFHRDIKSNKIG